MRNIEQRKIISGLDVMKFLMAFLIVDIHVHGSIITPPILREHVIQPLESMAVPLFFVISSFLFFRKARYAERLPGVVLHFVKRLAILYVFWCVVWNPIIYIQKEYFHPMTAWTPLCLVRDFFFGSMFDASWFLGALLVGVPLVALLMRCIKEWMGIVVCLIAYLFATSSNLLPDGCLVVDEWYKQYVGVDGMWLSFPSGLLWISMGYVLANKRVIAWMEGVRNGWTWIAALLFFVLASFMPIVPKILCVAALFVAAYTWQLPEHPQLYRRFRTYSILFYVIHDCFKKIPKQLFGWENGPMLFVVTIAFCFLASEFIMRMKEVKGFGWLRYAY